MTESLRQLNASNRANELTEANLTTALQLLKKLPPPFSESQIVLAGVLQSLSVVYAAEMGSTGK